MQKGPSQDTRETARGRPSGLPCSGGEQDVGTGGGTVCFPRAGTTSSHAHSLSPQAQQGQLQRGDGCPGLHLSPGAASVVMGASTGGGEHGQLCDGRPRLRDRGGPALRLPGWPGSDRVVHPGRSRAPRGLWMLGLGPLQAVSTAGSAQASRGPLPGLNYSCLGMPKLVQFYI